MLYEVITGCEVSPQPIDYGNEVCDFCKMTIVDTQHATEIVTKKGKTYKFDASECMVNFMNRITSYNVCYTKLLRVWIILHCLQTVCTSQ